MKTMRRVTVLVLVSAALLVTFGCGPATGALDGTNWRLQGWTLSSLDPAAFTITAAFAGGEISGKSGVNTYGGECRLGPGSTFAVSAIAATQMASADPDAMRAEGAYLKLLGEARSYRVSAGTLTLFDQGGNESLIFQTAGR